MLEHIIDGLLEEADKLTITLRSRAGPIRRQANSSGKSGPSTKVRKISFPGSNAQEAWNFS
jgi:meiotic recombination protein SPO11